MKEIISKKRLLELLNETAGTKYTEDSSKNLIELGLNSLTLMKYVYVLRKEHIKTSFAELIANPCVDYWYELFHGSEDSDEVLEKEESIEINENKTVDSVIEDNVFDMTELQYAYWVGSDEKEPLGGVSCHAYIELNGSGVEYEKLQEAYEQLFEYHPMLRTRVTQDGKLELMDKPFSTKVTLYDLRDKEEGECEAVLEKIRTTYSQRKMKVEEGESIGLSLTLLKDNRTRLHFELDLIFADVLSFAIILKDITMLYNKTGIPKAPKDWNFAKYLQKQKKIKKLAIEKSEEYWINKIDTLSGRPELPIRKSPKSIENATYKRYQQVIPQQIWGGLIDGCKKNGTTPAMALLAIYAAVLERYSNNSEFLLNIPLFNRDTDQGVEHVVSDFTNLLLVDVGVKENDTWNELVRRVQNVFRENVAYADYSGVKVQRELSRRRQGENFFAPVVYSYTIGTELIDSLCEESFGTLDYMITQTPQVWIDFQIVEIGHKILFSWDVVEELFPRELISEMFETLVELVEKLSKADGNWDFAVDAVNEKERKFAIENVGNASADIEEHIHTSLFAYGKDHGNKIAIIDTETGDKISYQELLSVIHKMHSMFKKEGVVTGDLVGFTLQRGVKQVCAAIAIASYGACYVPIGEKLPYERRKRVHERMGIKYLLTEEKCLEILEFPEGVHTICFEDYKKYDELQEEITFSNSELAYIILTSGTTGEPKGVKISHKNAWNTIRDVNRRLQVNDNDCILALASIDFDLSVYDIFGILGAGGTLLTISSEHAKDAYYWMKCIEEYKTTIWNSVPALLSMLLVAAESRKCNLPFRTVLLSGDWIGMDIPKRLRDVTNGCKLISLGGATEGSIWSNWFEVNLPMPEDWVSIPYGYALEGQCYRIVDEYGRDCPCWVTGELWIGGEGVAQGYQGDEELTEKKFVEKDGLRWYKTGDYGRYQEQHRIEFLGRKDNQVKVKGYRVELSEIESTLNRIPEVQSSVAIVTSTKQIVAFYISDVPMSEEELKQYASRYLAEYMVPVHIFYLTEFPITKNGKIDRKMLEEKVQLELKEEHQEENEQEELTEFQKLFLEKLTEFMEEAEETPSFKDSFIGAGGDSLSAMKLSAWLSEEYDVEVGIYDILDTKTIMDVYNLIQKRMGL